MTTKAARLSKSRFTSGLQCHKKLWWEVHEPDALELQPDKVARWVKRPEPATPAVC